jgi:ATP-binding cassette, subfamily B, bacterial
MVITSRFRPEALERHRRPDGLGPALGAEPGLHRPVGLQARIAAFRSSVQWLSRRHRIPVCLQTQSSDCGPACLVMALRYHQLPVSLDTVRAQADAGRNGASARTLLELARGFGLPGRGVRVDLDGLKQLSPGAILFWNFNHFVVLESASRDYVDIVDPAFGPRRLSRASVAEAFTGVALEFDAPLGRSQSPAAVEAHAEPDPWQRLREFLPRGRELGGLATTSFVLMAFELVLPLTTSYLVGHVLPKHASHPLGLVAAGLAAISVLFVFRGDAVTSLVHGHQAPGSDREAADLGSGRTPGHLALRLFHRPQLR